MRVVVFSGYFDIVCCLVENGVDVNVCNIFCFIFLIVVCYNGYIDVVFYFVENGVDIYL